MCAVCVVSWVQMYADVMKNRVAENDNPVLKLDKRDYPENLHVVFCANK